MAIIVGQHYKYYTYKLIKYMHTLSCRRLAVAHHIVLRQTVYWTLHIVDAFDLLISCTWK